MDNRKILIVEDEVILAESHKDKLISFGFEKILLAKNKEEALTILSLHNIDLALLDVRLNTGFEGIELGEYIHEKYGTPFIYLTAHSDRSTIERMIKSKPFGYLSKPVRKSELFATISLVLNSGNESSIVLTEAGTSYKFNKSSILFAESSGNYMVIHFANKEKPFLYRSNVDNLLNVFGVGFAKINRSVIVNTSQVNAFNKKELTIEDRVFRISKDAYDDLTLKI